MLKAGNNSPNGSSPTSLYSDINKEEENKACPKRGLFKKYVFIYFIICIFRK